MSAPHTTANDPVQGAIEEIISAMSSLNMPAEPNPDFTPQEWEQPFLVQTDRWAAHAAEHLQQAIVYLRKIRPEDLI
jgi:hypothetical protein